MDISFYPVFPLPNFFSAVFHGKQTPCDFLSFSSKSETLTSKQKKYFRICCLYVCSLS